MSIKVLYLPKNFYTSPKQISGYATGLQLSVNKENIIIFVDFISQNHYEHYN